MHSTAPFHCTSPTLWQGRTRDVLCSVDDLLRASGLSLRDAPYGVERDPRFTMRVPKSLSHRIRRGDWHDPILLQVLPRAEERNERPGFTHDPVGDRASLKAEGLLCKYSSRALLLVSSACPVHCRFCFRRCFKYTSTCACGISTGAWEWLARHREIDEVILSGGEPLMLDNRGLEQILSRVEMLEHVATCRIHTRMPIADPSRIDDALVERLWALGRRKTCVVVVHANCSREFDESVGTALGMLKSAGVMLLGQSVLLKGINDSVEALGDLFRTMIRTGIVPYYLHQLDRVKGASHFEVDQQRGKQLMAALQTRCAGYALPRYVREVASEKSKVLLFP